MNNNPEISSSNTSKNVSKDVLQEFLKQYDIFLGEHQSQVKLGGHMLELGTKTELVQQFEGFIQNPLKAMVDIKARADESIITFVEGMIKHFMFKMKESNLVSSAYKRENSGNDLHYNIVLSNDTFESRDIIFSFLNFYSCMDMAEKIHVHFQIVPREYIEKIPAAEPII